MKKIIILLLCIAAFTQVSAQKLIQKKVYWDIWETKLSLVWYETGNGIQHGEQKSYYPDGKQLMSYKKYNMGVVVHSTSYDAAGNITRVGNWDEDGNIEGEQKEYDYSNDKVYLKRKIFCKNKEVLSYFSYYDINKPKIAYEKDKFFYVYNESGDKTSNLSMKNNIINGYIEYGNGKYYFMNNELIKYSNWEDNLKLVTNNYGGIRMKYTEVIPLNDREGIMMFTEEHYEDTNKTTVSINKYSTLKEDRPLISKIYISYPDGNLYSDPSIYEIKEAFDSNLTFTPLQKFAVVCKDIYSYNDECLKQYFEYPNGQCKFNGDTTFYESGKIKSLGSKFEYYESGALKRNGDSMYFENGKIQTDGKNTWFENGNPNKKVLSDRTEYYYESGKIKRMEMSDSKKNIDYYENGNATTVWEKTTFNNNLCEITRNYYENGTLKDLTYQDQSGKKTYSSEEDLEKNQIRQQLESAYNDFSQTVLKELTSSLEMKGTIDFSRTEKGEISFKLSITPLEKSTDPSITDKLSSCISKTITNKSVVLPVYNKAYSLQEQISIQVVYGKEKVFVKSGKSLLSYGETETESNKPKKVNTACKNEIARKKIITDYTSQKAGVYIINYHTITINNNPTQIYLTQEKHKIHTVGGNILRYTGYTIVLAASVLVALSAQ